MVNDDSDDDGIPSIPANEIYTPPPHMTNFNMGGDEPSSDLFFNPYMQSDENLKEKDKFHNREECISAIKNSTCSTRSILRWTV